MTSIRSRYPRILQVFLAIWLAAGLCWGVVAAPELPDPGNPRMTRDQQKQIAQAYIAQLQQARLFGRPIVTRIDPLTGFYSAEDYQQDFLVHNTDYAYIVQNDLPKIANLKRLFPELYRDQPVLVGQRPD